MEKLVDICQRMRKTMPKLGQVSQFISLSCEPIEGCGTAFILLF